MLQHSVTAERYCICLYTSWIRPSGLFQNRINFWNYESF